MNKTVTIVLNGVLFHIEEEAYNKLKEYLDSIKQYYAGKNGDSEEILTDIESSVAEKFSAKLKTAKQVIAFADVEALIKVMGTVEDFAALEDDTVSEQKETSASEPADAQKQPRRFYRNPDDKIIAGVGSGIASYFNIDPVIIRLLFVVSIFVGGTGILLYIALWIIIPVAETSTQKLEMQGKPVTLAKLEQVSRELKERGKKGAQAAKKTLPKFLKFFDSIFRSLGTVLKKSGLLLSIIIGTVLAFSMIISIISVLFAAVVLLFNIDSPHIYFGYPFKDTIGASTYYLGISASFIIALIPLIFLLLIGIVMVKRKNIFTVVSTSILLAVWMCAILMIGAMAVDATPRIERIIDDIEARNSVTRSYNVEDFSKIKADGSFDITLTQSDEYSVTATGFDLNLDDLHIEKDGTTLLLNQRDNDLDYCIFCWTLRTKITIAMPAIQKIEGDYDSSFNLDGFEEELLEIEGIGEYFDSLKHRRDFMNTIQLQINELESNKQRTRFFSDLNSIQLIHDGQQFIIEISPLWEELNDTDTEEITEAEDPEDKATIPLPNNNE